MLGHRLRLFTIASAIAVTPLVARAQSAAQPVDAAVLDFTQQAPSAPTPNSEPAYPPAPPPETTAPAAVPAPSAPLRPHVAPVAAPVPDYGPHARGEASRYRPHALNFSVLGLVVGNLRLTYERLLRPKHGVYAEGIFAPDVLNGFDFIGYGGSMGYRFHWRGPGTGGFVGAGLTLLRHRGHTKVYDFDEKDTFTYRGSLFSVGFGPQIGKRWLWERAGVNLTIRFGAGVLFGKAYPKQNVPKRATDGLTRIPLGVEGELSVGYSF